MRRFGKVSIIAAFMLSLIPLTSQSSMFYSSTTDGLQNQIAHIINNGSPNAVLGVEIKSMKYNDILYAKNSNQSFVPASTAKILTAEAALLYLGPHYQFQTQFLTDAAPNENGVIQGNIYLVHSGDPTLTYEDLSDLMATLKSQQISRVTGNIYIDTTAYDGVTFGPGWSWNDTRFCYAAPISASIINHNCLSFLLTPSKTKGHPANIAGKNLAGVRNNVVTQSNRARSCSIRLGNNSGSITLEGCMRKGHAAQGVSTVVKNVVGYNQAMLRDLFNRYRIRVDGSFLSGTAPKNLNVLATHRSQPLSELITDMLKMSDNIIAGSLFKKMGSIYTKKPGTWENGSQAVTRILAEEAKVNTSGLMVIDGSGLSRFNQISPAQMMQVLDFAFHHDATSYEFISALPIAGVDGTLKRRLKNISWKVRAKTGTMSGVVSLAGYAISRDQEPIAFVIMVNGRTGFGWKYKALEDQIVTALTHYSRS